MKWFRGSLVLLVVAASFAAASGVARADDNGGGTTNARCSLSFSAGQIGITCTTTAGVTYSCTLQRTGVGAFGLDCSNSSTAAHLRCTFTLAPFTASCRRE